ncbi:MAG: hypothetical protein PWP40_2032 [Rhodocyclaceae bacterium]|nr:hypothetical protein [Rhodocyclaceae bacterium]
MLAPKILPWVARKAGITERDALDAWRHAVDLAAGEAGTRSGATFDGLAIERFVTLAHARGTGRAVRASRPAAGASRLRQRPVAQPCVG